MVLHVPPAAKENERAPTADYQPEKRGRIIDLDNFAIDLEIAKNTIIRIQRGVVVQVLPKGSLKATLGSNKAANDDKNVKLDKPAEDSDKDGDDADKA